MIPFTYINLLSMLAAQTTGSVGLRGLTASWAAGIAASFYAARAMDATCFDRMAEKHGVSQRTFAVFNALAHLAPLLLAARWQRHVTARRAALALALHLAWGAAASRGTLALDGVYVPMPRRTWLLLWTVASMVEGMTALGDPVLLCHGRSKHHVGR